MTVAEELLEMLRTYLPDFELDERRSRRRPPPGPGPRRERRRDPGARGDPDARGDQGTRRDQGARGDPGARGGAVKPSNPVLARCYADLGVRQGTDLRQVRRAWLRLVRKHHPDLCGADRERQRLGTELLKRFNHAYEEIRKQLQGPSSWQSS
jgi:DnaJ-domain-containing protein 1